MTNRQLTVMVIVLSVVVLALTGLLTYLLWANLSTDGLKGSIGKTEPVGDQGITEQTATAEPPRKPINAGGSYVRWGRTSCPAGVQLLYAGVTAGSPHHQYGGGANYICLHRQPEWANYKDGSEVDGTIANLASFLYGVEYYQVAAVFTGKNLQHHDVPCAVCHPPRWTVIMIPGRLSCPDTTWTVEYRGYLTTERHSHQNNKVFECLDDDPEVVQGEGDKSITAKFSTVETDCRRGSLPCPNYVEGREITCVVCSL